MNYKDWLAIWLENYVRPTAKSRTYEQYDYMVRLHVSPTLGETPLSDLTTMRLQHFITNLLQGGNLATGKGMAANTVNTVITVIQNSLKTASILGYIAESPAEKIKRPKKTERQIECFTPKEQKRIEDVCKSHKKAKMLGVVLCLYTGLRIGELLALEWSDIDFVKGVLTVSKTCRDGKGETGKHIVDTPKTVTSKRIIPLPRQIIPLLKSAKKESDCKYVVSEKGMPISTRSYQRSFELILKRAKVSRRGFHVLRHTFATRAIECGMDVKTLSEILGHKNPTVTLNRYVHSLMEHKKEMMNRVGKFF